MGLVVKVRFLCNFHSSNIAGSTVIVADSNDSCRDFSSVFSFHGVSGSVLPFTTASISFISTGVTSQLNRGTFLPKFVHSACEILLNNNAVFKPRYQSNPEKFAGYVVIHFLRASSGILHSLHLSTNDIDKACNLNIYFLDSINLGSKDFHPALLVIILFSNAENAVASFLLESLLSK